MERFLKRTARMIDGLVASTGERGLKVGAVRRIDDWTAVADVVGPDGVLAQRFTADRHTGAINRVL